MRRGSLWIGLAVILILAGALCLAATETLARLTLLSAAPPGKIFPEYSRVSYRTREFYAVASINKFGFRGEQTQISSGQIAIIGDSFVFGWGVNNDQTWPKRLENRLASTDRPLKVYNLGKPGADPDDYLDIARSYVPFLKPKILLISLLQGDDLAQLLLKAEESAAPRNANETKTTFLQTQFRGLLALAGLASTSASSVTENWSSDAKETIRKKHLTLPSDIRDWAESGNLNPGLLSYAAAFPGLMVAPYDDSHAAFLDKRLLDILGEIKKLVENDGGVLVVVSMPLGGYFPSAIRDNYSRMGFELPPLDFTKMDEVVKSLAARLGIQCIAMSNELRAHQELSNIWYKFDGHPTEYGYQLIAKYVFEALFRRGIL